MSVKIFARQMYGNGLDWANWGDFDIYFCLESFCGSLFFG